MCLSSQGTWDKSTILTIIYALTRMVLWDNGVKGIFVFYLFLG